LYRLINDVEDCNESESERAVIVVAACTQVRLLESATGLIKPTCANVSDAALKFPAQRPRALGWTRDEAVE
jgi:hypothetical protein